jgi:hypothetical protein
MRGKNTHHRHLRAIKTLSLRRLQDVSHKDMKILKEHEDFFMKMFCFELGLCMSLCKYSKYFEVR